jgi:hypothetical protein
MANRLTADLHTAGRVAATVVIQATVRRRATVTRHRIALVVGVLTAVARQVHTEVPVGTVRVVVGDTVAVAEATKDTVKLFDNLYFGDAVCGRRSFLPVVSGE